MICYDMICYITNVMLCYITHMLCYITHVMLYDTCNSMLYNT